MRFATIRMNNIVGIAAGERAGTVHALYPDDPGFPGSIDDLVSQGPSALAAAGAVLLGAPTIDIDSVEWLPPLQNPGKIICVGINYHEHAGESKHAIPDYPVIFGRFTSSLLGHGAPLVRPHVSVKFDYEGEFVAVIGTAGRDIPEESALAHVLGYSLFNDASVRDYQRKSHQWTVGKNFDGTGAFGPYLVTADELPAGCRGLQLQTRLNGQLVQDAPADDLIFDVAKLVSLLSVPFELRPGDIIVTGTPGGVGAARTPPLFMKSGDVCEVSMEPLGVLRNPVVDQPLPPRAGHEFNSRSRLGAGGAVVA